MECYSDGRLDLLERSVESRALKVRMRGKSCGLIAPHSRYTNQSMSSIHTSLLVAFRSCSPLLDVYGEPIEERAAGPPRLPALLPPDGWLDTAPLPCSNAGDLHRLTLDIEHRHSLT